MGQEIERKFLVKDDSYKLEAYAHSHIVQGYICRDVYKRQPIWGLSIGQTMIGGNIFIILI